MLRKVGFLFALMLTLPAIANAWTLAAKVSGTAGSIVVGADTVTVGSKYITVAGDASATIAADAGYKVALVTVDGVKATPVAGVVSITAPVAPKTTRSVVAYFSPLTSTVTVTQTAGGTVVAQMMNAAGTKAIGSISRTAIANIPSGGKVKITALPNADYKATDVAGTAFGAAIAGVPNSVIVTVTADAAYGATFAQVATLKANLVVLSTDLKPIGQTITAGTTIKLDASGSRSNGAINYTWAGCGTDAVTASSAIVAPAASCSVTVTATSALDAAVVKTATMNIVVNSEDANKTAVCTSCHATREAVSGIVTAYATSAYAAAANCQDCHAKAPHDAIKCSNCHDNAQSHAFAASGPTVINAGGYTACATCHVAKVADGARHNTALTKTSCIACHDIAIKHAGNVVNDNNGVRAIVGEFSKWSHHVTGVNLQDAHCAACHLEGKVVGGVVVVDSSKHMADAKTHLRNVDNDADYAWDPANPDHTLMDNFCMSCHDSNGATSAGSAAARGVMVAAPGKTASALNPFGDTISNRYDKMQRPAVVDAKGQFDTSNPSHHAVMGQKYSGRTRTAGERQINTPAAFANNSSATLVGKRSTIYDSRAVRTAAGTGHNAPYNVSKFVEAYETLSPVPGTTDKTLGDDSVLHCGDCHTVGQYRLADVGVAPKNAAVIGAHGSNNEYLLRNSIGTDERHVGQTYSSASGVNYFTNLGSPLLVCFNCHSYQNYGSIGNSTGANGTNHAGEYANAERCNGPVNTISFIGYTTSVNDTLEPYAFRLGLGQADGLVLTGSTKDTDFSNLFGMQCANCHNSGPNNLFGGIHGAKVKTYTDANGAAQKAYRFLPGLGNTMFVPGSATGVGTVSDLNWEVKSIGTVYNGTGAAKTAVIDNGGCYTLVPETGPGGTNADYALSPAFEQTVDQPAADTHIFGTWGGCDDHRGNAHGKAFSANGVPAGDYSGGTVATGGAGVTRKVLRPVTY